LILTKYKNKSERYSLGIGQLT